MVKFNELAKEIHDNAVNKGWYDGIPRTPLEIHMLMISEIAEATEEIRKNAHPLYCMDGEDTGSTFFGNPSVQGFLELPYGCKPEGESVELVDCVIRILDYFESKRWDFDMVSSLVCVDQSSELSLTVRPLETHLKFVASIIRSAQFEYQEHLEQGALASTVKSIKRYFEAKGWDFEKIIKLKHEYNKTRPYRHGNKSA